MIGLAGASKYVPLVLALPLAVAYGRSFFRSRAFYVSLLAIVVALFLASPYTFLDWKTTLKDMQTQRSALFSGLGRSDRLPLLPSHVPHPCRSPTRWGGRPTCWQSSAWGSSGAVGPRRTRSR